MQRLFFLMAVAIAMSCNQQQTTTPLSNGITPTASFTMTLDPDVPGKVNITGSSVNAASLYYELWLLSSSGVRGISSTYERTTSSDADTYFFIHENSEIEVELTVTSSSGNTDVTSRKMTISNVPTKVTVQKFEVTEVSLVDEDGYEWDDADGMMNSGYNFPEEYPDLLVNNDRFRMNKSHEEAGTIWDVNIQTDLPKELPVEQTHFESLSVQTDNYFIELLDFDGIQGAPGFQGAHRIGYKEINPYHLTHQYNDGEDGNFPDVLEITEDRFKARLYLKWE